MAENRGSGRKKRLVKNPETFRERALKSTSTEAKPKTSGRLKQAGGKIVSPVTKPVGQSVRKAYNYKPLGPLRAVLSFLAKILFISYVRKSWQELKFVTWPNWKESRRLTFAVLIFAVVFGAAIAGLDYGLDKIFKNILLK